MYNDTLQHLSETGAAKANLVKTRLLAFLVGGAMAGAYIGFGDIIMFTAGAHVDGAWVHLVMGAVFSAALTIVVFAGAELFTGMTMYMPIAVFAGRASIGDMIGVWIACWIGNLIGAFALAALLHAAGGGVLLGDGSQQFFNVVQAKMSAPAGQLLARGILCNWLVCLAIWMSTRTTDAAARIMLIFWPITIFVAAGFEHSVANMFAFCMALIGEHPEGVTIAGAVKNLFFVTIGNIIGGAVFIGCGYWLQGTGRAKAGEQTAKAGVPAE